MIVQFLIEDDDDKEVFVDLYIDKSKITAYYMPIDLDDCVNVLFDGVFLTFKQSEELIKYLLTERFYDD